jgi:hypothetical protein
MRKEVTSAPWCETWMWLGRLSTWRAGRQSSYGRASPLWR